MKRPRFLRISLRNLMIFVTITCVWIGWWIKSAMDQKNAVKQMGNGACSYDFEYDDYGKSRVFQSLVGLVGTDAVANVVSVHVYDENQDLSPLGCFPKIRDVWMIDHVTGDLSAVSGFKHLTEVNATCSA